MREIELGRVLCACLVPCYSLTLTVTSTSKYRYYKRAAKHQAAFAENSLKFLAHHRWFFLRSRIKPPVSNEDSPRYNDQASIRSFERFSESLRCYDWVAGVVPGLMDLDAVLERRGDVLILEGKHRRGNKIHVPLGQFLTLKTFSEKPGVEVWLVAEGEGAKTSRAKGYSVADIRALGTRGDFQLREGGVRMLGFYCSGPHARKRGWSQASLEDLREMLGEWWRERE